jgi:hypothetical protein
MIFQPKKSIAILKRGGVADMSDGSSNLPSAAATLLVQS